MKIIKITCYFFIIFNFQICNAYEKNQFTILKIENFFKKFVTLEANFIQVSPTGNISNGKIFLDLPGKLRIDYDNPKNLLITCKGFWIVIQDRVSKTTNNIPLKNSPFSILLQKKNIFYNDDFKTEYNSNSGVTSMKIKSSDDDKPEALIFEFSENPFSLKKWIIQDAMGENTTVLIQDAKYNNKLSHVLFFPITFPEPNE